MTVSTPFRPVDLLSGAVLLYKILKHETGMSSRTRVSQQGSSTTGCRVTSTLWLNKFRLDQQTQTETASKQMSDRNSSHTGYSPTGRAQSWQLNLYPDLNLAVPHLLLSATQNKQRWHQLLFFHYFEMKGLALSCCLTAKCMILNTKRTTTH